MEEIFFLTTNGGWTPGHHLICPFNVMMMIKKIIEALAGDKEKGCELTLVSCSLLCSSQNLFLFAGKKKKNFCARFWDCRPGCHNIVKKKYWNKDVKAQNTTRLEVFVTLSPGICNTSDFFFYFKLFLKYIYCTVTTMDYKKQTVHTGLFPSLWVRQRYLHSLDTRG